MASVPTGRQSDSQVGRLSDWQIVRLASLWEPAWAPGAPAAWGYLAV